MEKDNTNKLDALKRRRELLASLAARRRLNMISSSTRKQFEEGKAVNTSNANVKQVSSVHSNSSDVIEDSDVENDYHVNSNINRVVNSSGDSNDSFNTSTFCLPLAHAFFGSPLKLNDSTSFHSTKAKPKVRIISEIIIPPPGATATTSISPTMSDNMPNNSRIFQSPTMVNLSTKSEIEMLPDTQHRLQHVLPSTANNTILSNTSPGTEKCVLEAISQDLHPVALATAAIDVMYVSSEAKHGMVGTELEDTRQHSSQITPTMKTDVNIHSSLEFTKDTIKDSTKTTLMADNTAQINTSHDVQDITASLQTSTFPLDTDIDGQINSPPDMLEMGIQKVNQQAVALSPLTNDNIDSYEPTPGCSSENRIYSNVEDATNIRKRHIRPTINKAHVDYLSDEEQNDFSAGSSDLWSNYESDISSDDMKKKKTKKKTKKTQADHNEVDDKEAATLIKKKEKRCNVNKLRKKNKAEGKAYKTKTGANIPEKNMKENPCVENKCVKRCFDITEERRKSIFNHFWTLDSQRRRDWILRCIQRVPIKRKRTSTPESRRTATYEYFINDGEDHRKVCQKFLINTLDITQKYLTYTIHNSEDDMAKQDMRRPNVPQKYTEGTKNHIAEFIEKLPVLPSHYNRPKTGRMYLPQDYKSTMHIYRQYLKDCKMNGFQTVSEAVFRQIFSQYNISIHIPKKDKCQVCTKYENNKETNARDEKLQSHLEEKKATYRRFKSHQNIKLSNNDTITTSFDLQKVLNTPYGESMLLYYSRKYAMYNFTLYESGTQDVFCFTWGESDGKRGSNEIATCLLKYLKEIDLRGGVKNLLLYCDSCSGQNKNKTVLAVLNFFLKTSNNLEVIQINFLLPGHTYMPVDSVHAVIEREVKKLIVWSPSQWPTYFQSARKNPRPYRVEVLDHTDFLDFEELAGKTFPTSGSLKKVRIQQMRTATFKKKYPDEMRLKYSMIEEAEEIRVILHEGDLKTKHVKGRGKGPEKGKGKFKGKGKGKGKSKASTDNTQDTVDDSKQDVPGSMIKPAYYARLPISMAKYKDLMRLCENGTIPKTYHDEYRRIPCKDTVCDFFPHSDDEKNEEVNED